MHGWYWNLYRRVIGRRRWIGTEPAAAPTEEMHGPHMTMIPSLGIGMTTGRFS